MTPEQAAALIEMASDFSHGDAEVARRLRSALDKPPRTTREVGYYVSGKENDFEKCYRHLVSHLQPYTSSAEDKYVHEIFDQWFGEDRILREAPPELVRVFPEFLASHVAADEPPDSAGMVALVTARVQEHYVAGMRAVERAFADAGRPLLSLDTGGGDTLVFANVEPRIADRWRSRVLGRTYQGVELAVRPPMWDAFWHHVGYSLGLELGEPPPELSAR
jgi:hypothetical protein